MLRSSAVFLAAALAAIAACSSTAAAPNEGDDDDSDAATTPKSDAGTPDSAPPPDSGPKKMQVLPSREYSGFDGVHTFKLPIAVYGGGDDVQMTADDPTSATVTPTKLTNATGDKGVYFMIEVKTAGSIALTATSGGASAKATITVASYLPASWDAGNTRYNSPGVGTDPACKSCHVEGQAIDHSPAVLASATDTDVAKIITSGVLPTKTQIQSGCSTCDANGQKHQWTLTDDERRGLITYLRSLEPRGFE